MGLASKKLSYRTYNMKYRRDKCELSHELLKAKARELATQLPSEYEMSSLDAENASKEWILSVLKRNNWIGVQLHGEAGEISDGNKWNQATLNEPFEELGTVSSRFVKHNMSNMSQQVGSNATWYGHHSRIFRSHIFMGYNVDTIGLYAASDDEQEVLHEIRHWSVAISFFLLRWCL